MGLQDAHHGRSRSTSTAAIRLTFVCAGAVLMLTFSLGALGRTGQAGAKIVGPNACAECHKEETEAWKTSHHFKTFRELPRRKQANEIAEKMGVSRIRSEGLCLTCHYTVQQKDNRSEPIAGISCESCHGAGEDWIKVHSGFSGKSEKAETKAEAAARWKRADSAGMIRPGSLYDLAKNCYGCHVVPQEDLVNKGGHTAGSDFELLSWSQGEVRHTTWTSKGKTNAIAGPQRKRMLYLIGLGVELETSLRGVAKANSRKLYAFEMAKRADVARRQLAQIARAAPAVPEIARIVELGHASGLKLNNERGLTSSADSIAKLLEAMAEKYDGSTLAALDPLLPQPAAYKGAARPPGGAN